MMKFCALVVAATAILIDSASASTVPPDAPNQPPFSLSSLREHCDDQTGAAIVASVGSEYHFSLRPRSEINLPSEIPLTIRVAYRGGALTCYPAIIPPEGSTRPKIAAQVGVVMDVQFFTEGDAFNEQFDAEFRGRSGAVNFSYSTTPDKLQGTYRPDLPGYADVSVGVFGYFGGDLTNGEVVESGIPPGHVSELIPVAGWATYLDQAPAPTSTPVQTPTAPLFLPPTPCPSDAPCPPNTFRDCNDPASCACLCETFTPAPTPTATPTPAVLPCVGDCNGDSLVTIGDLITMVGIVLGNTPVDACPQLIYCEATCLPEIIAGVNNALRGCPTAPPTLSLSVHMARNPDTQILQAVADLTNTGGVPVSYLVGCTARCRPKFYQAISFQLIGPHDTEAIVEDPCGAVALCGEFPRMLSPGESVEQTLDITGTEFIQDTTPTSGIGECGSCSQAPLEPGRYTVTARFQYSTDLNNPWDFAYHIEASTDFDWP